jgi:hypothetical protein
MVDEYKTWATEELETYGKKLKAKIAQAYKKMRSLGTDYKTIQPYIDAIDHANYTLDKVRIEWKQRQ